MQLSIHETAFQKMFLQLINNQSKGYYKERFDNFNLTGTLDHSVTTNIFNLINTELASLKEIFPSLTKHKLNVQEEIRNLKKKIILKPKKSSISQIFDISYLIEYKFHSSLKSFETESNFLFSKFYASIHRLYSFTGIYEELYLLNSLVLSITGNATISYKNNNFTLLKGSTNISFQIFPIFFIIKFLLLDQYSDFKIQIVLKYLLEKISHSDEYLLTISDEEQIKKFFDYCNMKYLSEYVLTNVENNIPILLPKIITINQLSMMKNL